jgi:hypothetical protein
MYQMYYISTFDLTSLLEFMLLHIFIWMQKSNLTVSFPFGTFAVDLCIAYSEKDFRGRHADSPKFAEEILINSSYILGGRSVQTCTSADPN